MTAKDKQRANKIAAVEVQLNLILRGACGCELADETPSMLGIDVLRRFIGGVAAEWGIDADNWMLKHWSIETWDNLPKLAEWIVNAGGDADNQIKQKEQQGSK